MGAQTWRVCGSCERWRSVLRTIAGNERLQQRRMSSKRGTQALSLGELDGMGCMRQVWWREEAHTADSSHARGRRDSVPRWCFGGGDKMPSEVSRPSLLCLVTVGGRGQLFCYLWRGNDKARPVSSSDQGKTRAYSRRHWRKSDLQEGNFA